MLWYPLFQRRHAKCEEPEAAHRAAPAPVAVQTEYPYIACDEQLRLLLPEYQGLLSNQLGTQALASRLAPVVLSNGLALLFGLREHIYSDQADEVLRRLEQAAYKLHQPERYILAPHVLLALSRANEAVSMPNSAARSPSDLKAAFQQIVQWAWQHQASDIHINVHLQQSTSSVHFSVGGRYVAPEVYGAISTQLLMDMLAVVWMEIEGGNGAVFDPTKEQQGRCLVSLAQQQIQLRWASMAADTGPSVCLRLLDLGQGRQLPQLEQLGYQAEQLEQLRRLILADGGAVVLAGNVGSGKSTSLAALMQCIPAHRKVITLEDPVEFRLPFAIQNSLGRRLDMPTHEAFASKLRALKRSAMQDVLLGEVRDRETGRAFMDLVGAGVNVYTTLHAASAATISERLASDFIGVSREFMAMPGLLKLLVYQALLPKLCQYCAIDIGASSSALQIAADRWYQAAECLRFTLPRLRLRNTQGCEHCQQQALRDYYGYAGRQLLAELIEPALLLDADTRIRNARPLLDYDAELPPIVRQAWYCVGQGILAPHDVELRFGALETYVGIYAARQMRKL
ncbi:ATPase, T2SS/T4P/T4SS family [Alcaligenes endophyticus]|uniref:Flp pilus assembly complex ATPase component TadA n=1 Tax=Alcaligenes endophyticus TaxID=1929088 RepID=A0ABT8EI98_9BURK|nr:ATPase, T2SS/T4P/T4SS family [Alcaligenes endophyticus]MCX5592643.1 ATPase, T2SS/T4P/T4SS family [Alcaligenes endophyticus]MDN4121009.1 Flp pilus assembly complex ATPase component TadA [Alcaligenes endophyticus]